MRAEETQVVTCPACDAKYRIPTNFLGSKVACKKCGAPFRLEAPRPSDESTNGAAGSPLPTAADEVAQDDLYLLLGRMALKYRFLEKEQLRQALSYQEQKRREGRPMQLGDILLNQGMISRSQLDFLLSLQEMLKLRKLDRRFGVIAVKNGFATEQQIAAALAEQELIFKKNKVRTPLGDILIRSGILTERKKDAILALQRRITRTTEKPVSPPTAAEKDAAAAENRFELQVSEDGLSVFLILKGPDSPALEQVKGALKARKIDHGIIEQGRIEEYLEDPNRFQQPLRIATGIPPQPAHDARLQYHFPVHTEAGDDPGHLSTAASAHGVSTVQPGDLLLEKIPCEPGQPGIDVYGNPIAVPEAKDIQLLVGAGTAISEDGTGIVATVSGIPERIGRGTVAVVPVLDIAGDVDAETGHIHFDGAIRIAGTIQSGWRVTGTSVSAAEIRRAAVEAKGSVRVQGGVIGSRIKAGGEIRAKYVRDSDLQGWRDLVVEKEIIDSRIEISGACRIRQGAILSSRIAAKQGIEAKDIGSEASRPSILVVGKDVQLEKELAGIREAISLRELETDELTARRQTLQKDSERIQIEIGEIAQAQDRAMVTRRNAQDQLQQARQAGDTAAMEMNESLLQQLDPEIQQREQELEALFAEQDRVSEEESHIQKALREVEAEILRLQDEMAQWTEWANSEPGIPEVRATGRVFEKTAIEGLHDFLKVPKPLQNILIREQRSSSTERVRSWQLTVLVRRREDQMDEIS